MASQPVAPIENMKSSKDKTVENIKTKKRPTKKKKLTKEERLELKRQKRILAKEKALEAKKQAFRDYLHREVKYTELNYKRGVSRWEAICKEYKQKELQGDIEELKEVADQTLNNKNTTLQRMLTDLDSGEEDYRRHLSKHSDLLDYFINIHKHFVDRFRLAFEQDASNLIIDLKENIKEINKIDDDRYQFFGNVHHATNLITENSLRKMENNFTEMSQELTDIHFIKRTSNYKNIFNKMEQQYSEIRRIFKETQLTAASPEKHRFDLYNKYQARNTQARKEMKRFHEKSKVLHSTILQMRSELVVLETESASSIAKLRRERSYFEEIFWRLRDKCKKMVNKENELVKYFAAESYRNIQKLKQIEKHGELVLTLAASCRKLQMQKEKITPWTNEAQQNIKMFEQQSEKSEDEEEEENLLELFWNRVGQPHVHVRCLQKEKAELTSENNRLVQILRTYTNKLGVSTNADIQEFVQCKGINDSLDGTSSSKKEQCRFN